MAKYKVKDINKNGKIDSWEQAKYDAINKSADSPATMISTAMPGVDPMTGMIQQNQFAPSPVNPRALGGLQNQIPNIAGAAVPGMYDRVLPSPLAHNHDDIKIIGEQTYEFKQDKPSGNFVAGLSLDGGSADPVDTQDRIVITPKQRRKMKRAGEINNNYIEQMKEMTIKKDSVSGGKNFYSIKNKK